jgi:hypothetical protein
LLPERLLADPRPAQAALASAAWQVHPGSHHSAWRRLSTLLAFVALGSVAIVASSVVEDRQVE